MKVNLYTADAAEPFARNVELCEALADDDAETARAIHELNTAGRYWVGGGSAPLILMTRSGQ